MSCLARVTPVALEHHPGGGGEWDDNGGVFAALGAVDGDGVGVGEFVEFGEVVVDEFVFVGEHGEGLFVQGQAGDGSDGAVEDPGLAFVVVVAQLGDLVLTCSPAVLTVQAAGIRWVCPPSFQVAATSSGVR